MNKKGYIVVTDDGEYLVESTSGWLNYTTSPNINNATIFSERKDAIDAIEDYTIDDRDNYKIIPAISKTTVTLI